MKRESQNGKKMKRHKLRDLHENCLVEVVYTYLRSGGVIAKPTPFYEHEKKCILSTQPRWIKFLIKAWITWKLGIVKY